MGLWLPVYHACFLLSQSLTFSHNESTDPQNLKLTISQWKKCQDGEIVPGRGSSSSRGWVEYPLSMIDCFITGIVIYKQGNYLWSTVHGPVLEFPTHTHGQLIYINRPAAVNLLLLPVLWLLSLYQLPTHACIPSPYPWSFLTKRQEEGTPLKQGHVPIPQTHPFCVVSSTLSLMNLHVRLVCPAGPWWVLPVASPWPITPSRQ